MMKESSIESKTTACAQKRKGGKNRNLLM